ncbi:D-amino-acid transaminase [Bacillus sp. FJAT-42376]|uniref:D-amino-acid transaminase n=1 Tax=Bacillus sp. FJAT-42376 TaxID=2014076 RepID=UPI000F4D7B22|nr:D-amino-acid transaminase [Bacillus sp. FJAT-42376]AZB42166.1 D-amino-acid transaminase [Bacillus sp. FJAT-42376]
MKILMNQELIDRDQAKVDIEDRGYQFGDGVYEVIRVYDGEIFTMDEHLERLKRSAGEIKISLPYDLEELKDRVRELVSVNGVWDGGIYMQVTRGVSARNHLFPGPDVNAQLVAYPIPSKRPAELQKTGVEVITAEDMRWKRCDIKSLNLLWNVMAKQEASDAGKYETVFVRDGVITEGSSTNFYAVKDGTVYTHPANNFILNGITRLKIIEACRNAGVKVVEKEIPAADLDQYEEAFISSTTIEVMPVVKIDSRPFSSGRPGPVTLSIQKAFRDLLPDREKNRMV